jgi:Ca-activated chloride channel homolog
MSFTWPLAFLLLLVVPLLLGAHWLMRRRKRKGAVRFSSVALIRSAMPKRPSWKRHLPVALFLLGLSGLGVASARPQGSVTVPVGRTSIILALDVSGSMCATDVLPNRLTVAQAAAREFIKAQPSGTRIGIVAFAGFAELIVPPTTAKNDLLHAIDGLTTARGTTIGSAILKSIDAISAVNPDVPPVAADIGNNIESFDPRSFGADPATPEVVVPDSVPPPKDGYIPDIVVVLTDGANTRGITPVEAAKQAVSRRIRVYTIGFGTTNPTSMSCTADQLGGRVGDFGGFGGGGAGGGGGPRGGRFLVADDPTLRAVASMTGAAFYKAEDANQLKGVFAKLPKDVQLQRRKVELSAAFVGLGAVLAAVGMVLSMLWNRSP